MESLRLLLCCRHVITSILVVAAVTAHATCDSTLQMQLGNPSGATSITPADHHHFLIQRDEYAMDYNDTTHNANWVSWDLTAGDTGSVARPGFTSDPALQPAGLQPVQDACYLGLQGALGFNRGHICPNADRNDTTTHQAATFFISNVFPQHMNVNSGSWESFENYCRSLAQTAELLIISGPSIYGDHKYTNLNANPVIPLNIPSNCWKIVVVVPPGPGPAITRVTTTCAVLAVNIPNEDAPRTTPWTNFLTSVAEIEQQTGYTFFTALSGKIADDFRHRKCRIIPEFTDAALRNAISSARPDDNLLFIDSSPSHTVALTGGSLLIDKNLTIDASLVPGGVTIDAQGHSRILQAAPHTYTIFNSLTFTNGNATSTDAGGAILNAGYLHLYNCTFTRNQAGTGGAIWSTGLPHQDAGIWANKCAFTFNTATASGGSISSIGSGSCRFVNCMFLTNSSGEDGGAIQNLENAGLIVQECTFSGNHTDRHGGGISTASAGRVLIENSSFLYNNAGTQDGAIFTGSGDVTAANNNLVGNTVGRVGMLTSAVMLSTPHYVPITTAKKSRLLPPRLRSETF